MIDTWYYQRDDATRVPVQVFLTKQSRDEKYLDDKRNAPPFETLSVAMYVEVDGEQIESTDVEALRMAVWAKLDKKYAIRRERYYRVSVSPDRPYSGLGAGFVLAYHDVEKGTTWDGRLLLRERRHRGYHVEPWPGEFKDEKGEVQACIPASKTNTAGLEEFCRRIQTLREMLRRFLEPDKIEQVLQNLADFKLLPRANPALLEDKRRRRRSSGG